MEEEDIIDLFDSLFKIEHNYSSNTLTDKVVSTDPVIRNNRIRNTTSADGSSSGNSHAKYILFMEQLKAMNVDGLKAVTSFIYITGFIANIFLLSYIVIFKRYRSPTFAIIFSLACSDLGTCFGGCFLSIMVLPIVKGPEWFCPLAIYISTAFYICSVFHMTFFSILRFYQLVFPLAAHARITVSFVSKICAVIWPIAMASIIHSYTFFIPVTFIYKGNTVIVCDYDQRLMVRQLISETSVLLLPNILICSFQLTKHIIVRRQAKKSASDSYQQTGSRQTTDARAVTVVILAFCLTAMPQFVHTYLHRVFGLPMPPFHMTVDSISLNLIYLNSALNPFIYVFCASSVRRDVFKMITCKKHY